MAYRKWKPSKTAKREFAQKMNEIDEFCKEHGIHQSSSSDSYYFTLNGKDYRVSNHSVEASNARASTDLGEKIREKYHPNGREEDVIYIHASKTRIKEIYNNLVAGYELDGRGNIKESQTRPEEYYKMSDGFFDYYVNKNTGERKFKLEEKDRLVDAKLDDFHRPTQIEETKLTTESEKKYELTDIRQSVSISGESLYRIKALKEFVNEATGVVIEKGQLGGFVQSENNLSHSGTCWVDESARVFNNARVTDDAYIGGESMANKNTVIKDSAIVTGAAWITQSAKISGNAYIRDMAFIKGEAEIGGTAEVTGHHTIGGYTVLTSGIHNGTAAPAQITMQSQSLEM